MIFCSKTFWGIRFIDHILLIETHAMVHMQLCIKFYIFYLLKALCVFIPHIVQLILRK